METVSAESLAQLAEQLGENRAVLKAIADAAPGDEDVERAYQAFMHSYWIDDLTERIVRAQQQGLATGLDPQLAGEALGWMAERLVTQLQDRDPRQVLDTIIAILIKCLYTADPGRPAPTTRTSVRTPGSEPRTTGDSPEDTGAEHGVGPSAVTESESVTDSESVTESDVASLPTNPLDDPAG
jgi:hypothetical protein